jgi:cell division protein ZapE
LATIGAPKSLASVNPQVSTEDLVAHLVPPREFRSARFENYLPDSNFPSQADAIREAKAFLGLKDSSGLKGLFAKREAPKSGLYLDGGFGVGKTHILASIWHAASGRKAFGSFLAYTGLIGVLGFANAVQAFSKYDLICIDEFELDDPGDTMMMSRLLTELDAKGVRFATTSNTPPNALGQGRFAAADFAREISAMADKFKMISIDGEDYRHRPTEAHVPALTETELDTWAKQQQESGKSVFADSFDVLLKHLSTVHPSKYADMVEDVDALVLTGVRQLTDQVEALRWVALIDRLYERQVSLRASGTPVTDSFSAEMTAGGYRKKYLRAVSRLGAMSSQ